MSWSPGACPTADPSATGFAVGDVIGALPVRDCFTGEPASLDEVCGASATWIFSAHTHCPTCKATAGFTDDVAKAVADRNVAIVHTVYDDNGTSCAQWAAAYGFASYPNVRVFEDPGGAVWSLLKLSSYTAPSAFLDGERRITHKEHGMSKAAVLAEVDAILAP
jgi:thiol-disulfide isomerase/thioredoxin